MAEVDTSSYPKLPATPPSFLDVAGKIQGLQSGALTMQQQQLNLIKDRFQQVAGQIPGLLSKPDLNQNDIAQFYRNNVANGYITADQAATKLSQLPPTQGMPPAQAALTLKNHMGNELQQAMSTMDALHYHLGGQGQVDTGQQIVPTLSSPKPGFAGNRQTGGVIAPQNGIQVQPPPTLPTVSTGAPGQPPVGTPGYLGSQSGKTGLPTAPGALPVGPNPTRGNIQGMGNVTSIDVGPDQPNMGGVPTSGTPNKVPTQSFIQGGNTPLFEAGKSQYVQDQDMATQRLTAMKPALQALPLMKDIMSGPGTAGFTHALAGLKAFGIIPTNVNDPVLARQEVLKKLNQYVGSSPAAQRSDAGLLQTEASSPSPNIQNLPALKKLTMDAIALDRIQAARPGAFAGQDFSKYPSHRSSFPGQMDERAFQLDLMEPKERQALINQMKKNRSTAAGQRFWNSLNVADQQPGLGQ